MSQVSSLFFRPDFQLRSLAVNIRWEVTRRHPLSQVFWQGVDLSHFGLPISEKETRLLNEYFVALRELCLGAIRVSGQLFDPRLEFHEIEVENLNSSWLSGAVHPISMRGLAGLIITALPKEVLGQVGFWMVTAGCDDEEGKVPKRIQALRALSNLSNDSLDSYIDEPFVSINPAASMKQIEKSMASLVKEWKSQRGLSEKRDRSGKHQDYLEVWDLREGWNGGKYDFRAEMTLKQIAKNKGKLTPTIQTQYEKAFEIISGHSLSVENWCTLIAPLKVNSLSGGIGLATRNRALNSKVRRDVPDSVLQSHSDDRTVTGKAMVTEYVGGDEEQLAIRIFKLIGEGRSNQEISTALEFVHDESCEAIEFLRNRMSEFSSN